MSPQDLLLTYAEVAVALAGFSGIVAAFRQNRDAPSPFDVNSVRFVLEVSLTAILFSVVPGVLQAFSIPESAAFRIAAFALTGALLVLYVTQARRRQRVADQHGFAPRAIRGRPLLLTIYLAITGGLALSGLSGVATAGAYLVANGMLLVAAGIEFLAFVAGLQKPEPVAQASPGSDAPAPSPPHSDRPLDGNAD